ncbi:MAG TPA: PIG-L family deacetylase [Candidatus Saccharimonadales bacterium]|nr:PIG-L family deacetylase [Candidatus Saccharimonadales bacterium]
MKNHDFLVSPHLDDVPLSASSVLKRGSKVITVMAGAPENCEADEWNGTTTGQKFASEALAIRVAEDKAVAGRLGLTAVRLSYWDMPYLNSKPRNIKPIVRELGGILTGARSVYTALGIWHEDHVNTSNATLEALRQTDFFGKGGELRLYQDTPYGDEYPKLRDERLDELRDRGYTLTAEDPILLTPDEVQQKSEILNLYASQIQPLREAFETDFDEAIATEKMWRVGVPR